MPSKIQLDENLHFLYICLQNSDYKNIDFSAVGAATHLKPPAARMRYTRLRRQIEGGTLRGRPFQRGCGEGGGVGGKRKRGGGGGVGEGDDEEEGGVIVEEGKEGREGREVVVVKTGDRVVEDGYESDIPCETETDSAPLAKRTAKLQVTGKFQDTSPDPQQHHTTPRTVHSPNPPISDSSPHPAATNNDVANPASSESHGG